MKSTAHLGSTHAQTLQSHPFPIYSATLIDKLDSLTSTLEAKKLELKRLNNNNELLDKEIIGLKQGISNMNCKS